MWVRGERTGSAVSRLRRKAFAIGAQPSAWMQASAGTLSISPIVFSSTKPFMAPAGPNPAADGLDVPTRRPPWRLPDRVIGAVGARVQAGLARQLLRQLIGNGFHAFHRRDAAQAAV